MHYGLRSWQWASEMHGSFFCDLIYGLYWKCSLCAPKEGPSPFSWSRSRSESPRWLLLLFMSLLSLLIFLLNLSVLEKGLLKFLITIIDLSFTHLSVQFCQLFLDIFFNYIIMYVYVMNISFSVFLLLVYTVLLLH